MNNAEAVELLRDILKSASADDRLYDAEALRHAIAVLSQKAPVSCNPHPDAPHGFNRNASHAADCYVCDCEGWEPPADTKIAHLKELSERADEATRVWHESGKRNDWLLASGTTQTFETAASNYVRELIAKETP